MIAPIKSLMIAVPLVLAAAGLATSQNPSSGQSNLDAEIDAVIKSEADNETKVFLLQKLQRKHADQFSWKLHNELRHLFSFGHPAEALEQSDILLAHSTMDRYVLNILSGWELEKQPKTAIANLLRCARISRGCEFVKAACWIQVGDLYREAGASTAAELYYHKVLTMDGMESSAYQSLAESRLGLRP